MSDHYCCKRCGLRYDDCICDAGFPMPPGEEPRALGTDKFRLKNKPKAKFDVDPLVPESAPTLPVWTEADEAALTVLAKKRTAVEEGRLVQLANLFASATVGTLESSAALRDVQRAFVAHAQEYAVHWIRALRPYVKSGDIE